MERCSIKKKRGLLEQLIASASYTFIGSIGRIRLLIFKDLTALLALLIILGPIYVAIVFLKLVGT